MEITPEILQKYHLGLCTAAEEKEVAAWLEDGSTLGRYEQIGNRTTKERADANMRKLLAEKSGANLHRTGTGTLRLPWSWVAAACLFIGISIGVWSALRQAAETTSVAFREVTAPYGKKLTVTLPDSTTVYLNAGSTLYYPEHFTDSIRLVSMEGEAFFDVVTDAGHPFIINSTHGTQVQVLGTAFNIRANAFDDEVEVSVQEGAVRFGNIEHAVDPITLSAGQRAAYSVQANRMAKFANADVQAWSWKDGLLAFDREQLRDIAGKMERWYGVEIEIADENTGKLRYSGTYKNPNLYTLLENMGFVLGFRYSVDKESKKVMIH